MNYLSIKHIALQLIIPVLNWLLWNSEWYGVSIDNTVEENLSIFCLIQMCQSLSAKVYRQQSSTYQDLQTYAAS